MALTKTFQEAVTYGNVRKIRIMLKDSLLVDPTFERFNEMERAAASVKGLYDEHDGRSFIENPDEWDDSYMDKIMVQVVGNFSHERVDHLKKVVRKLRPVAKKTSQNNRPVSVDSSYRSNERVRSTYQEQKRQDQRKGNYKYAVIGGGAVIGGIAGCVGGTIASLPVGGVVGCTIGGAVIGAATGGVVFHFTK